MLIFTPANEGLIGRRLNARDRNLTGSIIAGNTRSCFEERQRLTSIRARQAHKSGHGLVRNRKTPAKATLVRQRTTNEPLDCIRIKRTQGQQERARQERRNHRERWIFSRRCDEDDPPILDCRKERVLLRFREAMHLVDEQNGFFSPAGESSTRIIDNTPHVTDARGNGGELDKPPSRCARYQIRERRLTSTRRTPEHNGGHCNTVAGSRREKAPQRRPLTEQVRLSNDLCKCRRTHTNGEGRARIECRHARLVDRFRIKQIHEP